MNQGLVDAATGAANRARELESRVAELERAFADLYEYLLEAGDTEEVTEWLRFISRRFVGKEGRE